MAKITLGLEHLRVETFETNPARDPGASGLLGYTDSCAPDPMSRCGPNYCNPAFEPTPPYNCA